MQSSFPPAGDKGGYPQPAATFAEGSAANDEGNARDFLFCFYPRLTALLLLCSQFGRKAVRRFSKTRTPICALTQGLKGKRTSKTTLKILFSPSSSGVRILPRSFPLLLLIAKANVYHGVDDKFA
ncbi:hypothetical protein, partial [Gordonibacter sp.]|uniref:hypothetical protein n=1 Tax=Gordonibacter sp. TaxID=1968902 RepID=UPI002FC598D0